MPGRKIRDESDARACLRAVEASGLERSRWARQHGVDARSLNAWRLNLARREVSTGAVTFVELVPDLDGDSWEGRAVDTSRTLRLEAGLYAIEIPEDFDEVHLSRVLRVVATC